MTALIRLVSAVLVDPLDRMASARRTKPIIEDLIFGNVLILPLTPVE